MHEVAKIRCLIVDDEPPGREILRKYVEQLPMLELAGECANAIEAIRVLQKGDIGLLLASP